MGKKKITIVIQIIEVRKLMHLEIRDFSSITELAAKPNGSPESQPSAPLIQLSDLPRRVFQFLKRISQTEILAL